MADFKSNKQPLIEARHIGKRRGERWVFRLVDLQLYEGECVGILGPSGVGKTTLLRGLLGFECFDEGAVLIEGCIKPIERLRSPQLRLKFGFVAQSNNLWPYRTILDNVAEGLRFGLRREVREAREISKHWLIRMGLGQHIHKYPGELSGGEQQRVAIARALVVNPKAILLDEPTSGLDPITAGELSELLLQLRSEGISFLIVSHQIDLLRRMCDRVYFLHDGHVLENGPANEILTNPKTPELAEFVARVRLGW